MAAEKTTITTKTTGDQLTAAEFNDLVTKYNATIDIINAGVSGSFTTVDSKTVTVVNGIITAIE